MVRPELLFWEIDSVPTSSETSVFPMKIMAFMSVNQLIRRLGDWFLVRAIRLVEMS